MTNDSLYWVLSRASWGRDIFESRLTQYPGRWELITDPDNLTMDKLEAAAPSKLFFLHWSNIVPKDILEQYECICFHMTDLPYGRGGSPLQNLIVRGVKQTQLTAFQMTEELDAGPIYLKQDLSLEGNAQEIFQRAMNTAAGMIDIILTESPRPVPQSGKVIEFRRRKPHQSELSNEMSINEVFNHIRMLDAESYPPAFLDLEDVRILFSNARMENGQIRAEVTIRPREENK